MADENPRARDAAPPLTSLPPPPSGRVGTLVAVAIALGAALPLLNFLAEHAPGVAAWIVLNLQILWAVPYVKNGVAIIAFSTAFALFWPYVLSLPPLRVGRWTLRLADPDMTSARAQASVRLMTFGVALVQGLWLDPSRVGVIFALGYAMGAPFASMILIRAAQRFEWFRPLALQPTRDEAAAVSELAEAAAAEPAKPEKQ